MPINRYKTRNREEEPEINLVPFIDVLLVIIIFLAVSTSYSKLSQLNIKLPSADAVSIENKSNQIEISITFDGKLFANGDPIEFTSPLKFAQQLQLLSKGNDDPTIIINADAETTHQSVINIMESCRLAGYTKVNFLTKKNKKIKKKINFFFILI